MKYATSCSCETLTAILPKKMKNKVTTLIIISSIIIVIPFAIKFYSYSFTDSNPENWVEFVNYFNGILNPILTIINILIFINLTLTVQRATENKTLVSKTEDYILKHSELYTDLASEVMFFAQFLDEQKSILNIEDLKRETEKVQLHLSTTKELYKRKIYKNQFDLRIFAENQLFKDCKNQKKLINKSSKISETLNNFFNTINGQQNTDEIKNKYQIFEKELKEFVEIGKKFSDEIYKL